MIYLEECLEPELRALARHLACDAFLHLRVKKASRFKYVWGFHIFPASRKSLVGGLVAIFWIFPFILGISSSQLTNSYFSEGWLNHQPDPHFRFFGPALTPGWWWYGPAGRCSFFVFGITMQLDKPEFSPHESTRSIGNFSMGIFPWNFPPFHMGWISHRNFPCFRNRSAPWNKWHINRTMGCSEIYIIREIREST